MSDLDILKRLVEKGVLKEEDIFEADNHIHSVNRKMAVSRIHLICCKKDHNVAKCSWYLEEADWDAPAHTEWTEIVYSIRRKYLLSWDDIESISDILRSITPDILSAITFLFNLTPEAISSNTSDSGDCA